MRTLIIAFLLTTGMASANSTPIEGGEKIWFMCDGNSAKGHVELTQYRVNGNLGPLVVQRGDQTITTNVMGRNNFPVDAPIGESVYGTPPYSELRLELRSGVSISARFRADLWEDNFSHPIELRCRLF
jgi:hypothetical protein